MLRTLASSRALPAKVVQMMFGEPLGTRSNLCCQSKLYPQQERGPAGGPQGQELVGQGRTNPAASGAIVPRQLDDRGQKKGDALRIGRPGHEEKRPQVDRAAFDALGQGQAGQPEIEERQGPEDPAVERIVRIVARPIIRPAIGQQIERRALGPSRVSFEGRSRRPLLRCRRGGDQFVEDPFRRMAVPERRNLSPALRAGEQAVDVPEESLEPRQAIAAQGHRDRSFGVGSQGQAGRTKVCRFLLEAAGIRQDDPRVFRQAEGGVVAKRIEQDIGGRQPGGGGRIRRASYGCADGPERRPEDASTSPPNRS